ncbi:MAG: twin-arginine translocase TatA/TatE family subunit [Coriobacteriaceae bacterium]|jgi:sec-independent protein translocase protein TatA|nr:twin-arginine translocase TatA/TatE family subunit [Coriobacteriaceae bacterium]
MKFLGMGVPELLIILAVALLIFGPKNLPKLGSALGKTVKNLRDGMGSADKDAEEEGIDEEVIDEESPVKTAAKKAASSSQTKTANKK